MLLFAKTPITVAKNPSPGAGTLRNPPAEPSEPCLRNLHQHAPELFGTLRNLPELASGTYHFTPELSGTLPEPASGTYTSRRRNFPELSGTFRNLPPEPAPATRTGTHRSLSGLKTPLACAVGEKNIIKNQSDVILILFGAGKSSPKVFGPKTCWKLLALHADQVNQEAALRVGARLGHLPTG